MPKKKKKQEKTVFDLHPDMTYTKTPNLIHDELTRILSGAELKIVLRICRNTCGWGKIADKIAITQLMETCNLSRWSVISATKNLINMNIIKRVIGTGHTISKYEIEYNMSKWDLKERSKNQTAKREVKKLDLRGLKNRPERSKNQTSRGLKTRPTKESIKKLIKEIIKKSTFAKEGINMSSNNKRNNKSIPFVYNKGLEGIEKVRITYEIMNETQKIWINAIKSGIKENIDRAYEMVEFARKHDKDRVFDVFHTVGEVIRKEDEKLYLLVFPMFTNIKAKNVRPAIDRLIENEVDVEHYIKWFLKKRQANMSGNGFKGLTWSYFTAPSFFAEYAAELKIKSKPKKQTAQDREKEKEDRIQESLRRSRERYAQRNK